MKHIKIIIEVSGGIIQNVYSNGPLEYVVVDYDMIVQGRHPVTMPCKPDIIRDELNTIYDSTIPPEQEIRESLKRIKF